MDTGFASEENRRDLQRAGGHSIMGEKLRAGRANLEALARIAAALERKRRADDRRDAEALLLAHPSMGRYLTRRHGRLLVERQRVKAEERVDGKFLLTSSDDSLSAEDIALGYKQLIEVERGRRTLKHTLDLPPSTTAKRTGSAPTSCSASSPSC